MRATLWETARIEGNDTIRFPQLIDHLSDSHRDQRPVVPERGADKVLQDLSLDMDEGGNLLSILAAQVGSQAFQVERHMALADLGLKRLLLGHHEITQTLHHLMEHVGGNDAITPQCFSPLGPRGCHLFASLEWHTDRGCSLEATDTTKRYGAQRGAKEERQ